MTANTLVGQSVGGWVIEEPLGEGGMAAVYRARRAEQIVAVKVILPTLANAAEFVARFQREARLMAALDHPHILPVYDYGIENGIIYLAMRLMSGGSLHSKLIGGPLSLSEAVPLIEQIASALDYAHGRGIVHRDLKPANVLMDDQGRAYLTDFGIAKWTEETTGLTMTGMIIGTPGYMAPEQWRTEPVDPRTDVYALGIMIYEILGGEMPFRAETPFSLMYRHLDEPPPAVTDINHRLPKAVDHVIRRAMAKVPNRRYPSAGALALSLREIVQDQQATDMIGFDRATSLDARAIDGGGSGEEDTYILSAADEVTYRLDTEKPTLQDDPATITMAPASDLETLLETGRDSYNSIDAGARTLLARARETVRESEGSTAILAEAVIEYVEDLREQAKHRPGTDEGPYKALESYDIADNRLFFGREKAIDAMLARSPFSRFTVLHAESGAGKTSLIRAGVMPRLLAGGFLPVYVAVRRTPPHDAIKRALLPDPPPELANASLRTVLKGLQQSAGPNREIFIFVDQFETFFTDVFTDEQRAAFVSEIAECLDDQLLPLRFTVALRTEYFGLLASFQPHIPQPFANEFLLRRLTREEAARALVLPVREQGYDYDGAVAELILSDLADASGEIAPPQLQLVGSALIDALPPGRISVTEADYVQAGGAAGVLRSYLERLLAQLPVEDRKPAQVIIESLVREDQTRDVRRPDSLRAELDVLGVPTDRFDAILRALRENHVLRLVEVEEGIAYELVHDYLAMQIQLDPETAARKAAQELLDRRVRDYERYQSPLTRQELGVITAQEDLLRLDDTARALIARSRAVHRRQRRIALGLSAASILGLIGILALALFAAARESRNRQDRLEAAQTAEARIKTERDTSMLTESRMLADLAAQQLEVDPVASLNLGIQALTPADRPYVPEAEWALSRAVQTSNERAYLPSGGRVFGATWNADESRVLTWSADGTARLFDADSGAEVARLGTGSDAFVAAAWSPDGLRVLAAGYNGTAHIFDADSGAEIFALAGSTGHLTGAAWNGDGSRVLTWGDGGAREWSANTGADLHTFDQAAVVTAAWSPDETRILTAGDDYRVRVWDVKTGSRLWELNGHVNRLQGAAWNATGAQIVSYGDDHTAIVWNAATGEILFTLAGHTDRVTSAVWSPGESLLATTGYDGQMIVWDAVTGAERQRIAVGAVVDGARWNADGSRLLTWGEPDAVGVWDAATGERRAALIGHSRTVHGAWWNADESRILTYSRDGTARIWDAYSGAALAQMIGHGDSLNTALWSADGTRILTAGDDGSARIWVFTRDGVPVGTGDLRRFAPDEASGHARVAVWTADETQAVAAYQDGSLRVWNIATGAEVQHLTGHTDQVESLVWSPDHTRLISGSVDKTARIWDIAAGQTVAILEHDKPVIWVGWNHDGSRAITGSEDTTARVWDATTGDLLLTLSGHTGTVASAAWNGSESHILTASNDGTLRIWDAVSGLALSEIAVSNLPLLGATWSADNLRILTWGYDGAVHIYDATSGRELRRLATHNDWVIRALWNADESRVLAVGSSGDPTARIWDVEQGIEIQRFEGHTDSVIGAAWNADESRILTWSVDGTARVWDVDTGGEILRLDSHTARIWTAAWNADETRILTSSDDGTVRVWQAWPDRADLLADADAITTRPLSAAQRDLFFLPPAPATAAPTVFPTLTPTAPPPTSDGSSVSAWLPVRPRW